MTTSALARSRSRLMPVVLSSCIALGAVGCTDAQNNQKAMFGALSGGALASGACLLARGNALTCAAIGISGALVGGAIGHAFDERDRAQREAAVRQALLDQRLWLPQPGLHYDAPAPAGDQTEAELEAATPPSPQPISRQQSRATAARTVAAAPPVTWQNPDTSDSGTIVPLRTFASPSSGQACKVYREDYIRDGKKYSDTMQACPKASGSGFDFKVLS